jgi:protein-disulfide isomerase
MQKSFKYFLAFAVAVVLSLVPHLHAQTQTGNAPQDQPQVYKESDLPSGTLTGLTDSQKETVLKVINTKPCTCGCSNDTIAKCRIHDPTCGTAPKLIAQTIDMVKSGKSAEEIGQVIDATKKAAPQPAPQQQQKPAMPTAASYVALRADDPVRGPKLAKVTIVEFSEFQCPFCGRVEPTVKQILDTYKDNVRIVWKHQPLPFHPNAMPAAEAAEAAREQGKFWEMHDLMFAHQNDLSSGNYSEWAAMLGLDMDQFNQSIAGHKNQTRIKEDSTLGNSIGAGGTPTFFINGQLLVGAVPFENFKQVIDAELAKSDALLKTHTLDANFYKVAVDENVKNAKPLQPPAPPQPQVFNVQFRADDPVAGPKFAKVTIVEFSEFQCPFCGRVEPTLKQIRTTYGDSVRIVWKHQPLPFHPNAMPAAEASEAARKQGKFWEMHDLMFANQSLLSPDKYEEWAKQIGLNVDDFKESIGTHEAQPRIQEDMKQGQGIGAGGTPTFFINGRQVVGALPLEAFKNVIDEEVAKADALIKSGHPLDDKFYEVIVGNNVKDAAKPKPSEVM